MPAATRHNQDAQPTATRPGAVSDVLMLQQWAGNRAVTALMVQRDEGPEPQVPARYADLVTPSLSEADRVMLHKVTGGADTVTMIEQRDTIRTQLASLNRGVSAGDVGEGAAAQDFEALEPRERELTRQIDASLAELGVTSEDELFDLVHAFPARFLGEATQVALDMLAHNEDEARGELDRYSEQVCSPDIDGLLDADRRLSELDPAPLENSIAAAESALSTYGPAAGVLTLDELAALIPESQGSVIVDIANLDKTRAQVEQRRALYNAARFAEGRRFPILLSSDYHPGTFSMAPPEDLGKLVAEPVNDILSNISRVRDAINDDDMKVWHMRDVLRITEERLDVHNPVLLSAIETRIASIERDETFMSWVTTALAITTSVVAGMLFTPAAGAAVAALWGTRSLVSNIDTYLNESAAENVALDPTAADISMNEPTLTWVLLDAVGLGLDLGAAAKGLRSVARLLGESPNALTLRAFRRQAAQEFGDDVAEQLASQAARRHGIAAAGQQIAEEQLAHARTVLAGLDLPEDALARILAKGSNVEQLKGQLFEEVLHADVARRLAAGGDELLGVADSAGVEVIQGHRIKDMAGRQLTDGMIVRRQADGSLTIMTVLEAKAGRSAAQGLKTTSHGIEDAEEFARFVIDENKAGVVNVLRKAGLDAEADAVVAGGEALSDTAIDAIVQDKSMRGIARQAEYGGQVRRDVERLSPNVSDVEGLGADDVSPIQVLIDDTPTTVHMSPTRTRFVGAVPQDVPVESITKALTDSGFSFSAMQVGDRAAGLAAKAQQLADYVTP